MLSAAGAAAAQSITTGITSEFIFERAPFASAHASTIVETKNGLVAAWFGGSREGANDVGIWMSRRTASGWSAPREIAVGNQLPCWNPVLFQAPFGGPLILFYKEGPQPAAWWGMMQTSIDAGESWSAARRLPDGIIGPVKNKPVVLANGDLLAGSSTESLDSPSKWRVHFERTSDLGRTWTSTSPAAPGMDAIQPSILIHAGGVLQAVGRSRSQRVWTSWSRDSGRTWSALALTTLPNPNAGTDAVTLRDGRQLIVYNHSERARSPLNVALARDGITWDQVLALETEPGEYSYPAVIQTSDGLMHITYTWKRERIKHVVLDPSKLTGPASQPKPSSFPRSHR